MAATVKLTREAVGLWTARVTDEVTVNVWMVKRGTYSVVYFVNGQPVDHETMRDSLANVAGRIADWASA